MASVIAGLGVSQVADRIDISGGAPGTASESAAEEKPRQFGLPAAMALMFPVSFIWYSRNTGSGFCACRALYFLAAALLPRIPVYLGQRRHMGQPVPVPPYR